MDLFLGLVGAGRSPPRGGAGGQAWWLPRSVCRRDRLDAEGMGRLRSFGGCKGRWGNAWFSA
jgi:hypothetical protein